MVPLKFLSSPVNAKNKMKTRQELFQPIILNIENASLWKCLYF